MNTPFEEFTNGGTLIFESITKEEWEDIDTDDYSEYNQDNSKIDTNLYPYYKSENFEIKPLSCWVCQLSFSDYSSFIFHHIQHVTQPYVLLKDINSGKFSNSKITSESQNDHLPLKLTLKKSTEPNKSLSFKVVNHKKKAGGSGHKGAGRRSAKTDTDTNIQGGEGEQSSPALTATSTFNAPSPTPSEFLRPEGFLAPENAVPSPDENNEQNEESVIQDGYPSSPPQLTPEDLESSLPTTDDDDPSNSDGNLRENGLEGMDSEPELRNTDEENNINSGTVSEREFPNFESSESTISLTPTSSSVPPSNPTGRTLTVLAPSQVNNNVVVNGALLSEQAESNVVSEAFNALGNLDNNDSNEVRDGVSGLSTAKLFSNSSNMMDMHSNNDPLGLLRNYIDPQQNNGMEFMPLDRLPGETCEVCGERTVDIDAMEQHKSTMGHFKCHLLPDCAVVLFGSAAELTNHQQVAHGIMPTPPPVQQLAQQVQRLPVPYQGMGTPPQSASPGYQNRSSPMYRVPTPLHMYPQQPSPSAYNGTSPFQGMSMNQQQQQIPMTQMSPGRVQKRPGSVGSAEGAPSKRRNDDTDCSLISVQQQPLSVPAMPSLPGITLSVRGQPPPQPQAPQQPNKKNDASSVANILATRGITVTPTGSRGVPQPIGTSPRRSQQPQVQPQPLTTLNLSSAISITPANQASKQNQFAIPQGRSVGRQPVQVERPPRLPTVDLTQDTPTVRSRNRMARFTCQVCDKVFSSQDILNQHMITHRSPTKLPFRCNLCNAQYPTQQGLQQHRLTYHKETATEMAIPIVDLKQQGVRQKLSSLGISHVILLSQLTNQSNGTFGLPIVAIDNASNPAVCNLGRLGASNVFSIGPAKPVGR